HEVGLVERLWRRLAEIDGITAYGHRDHARRGGTLSFRSDALPAGGPGGLLHPAFGIAIRPGLHLAPHVPKALGTFPEGLVRVSPGPFNTAADVDRLADAVAEILN